MNNLIWIIEKCLRQPGDSGMKQAQLLRMAGDCETLRILILLAYRDDAAEILRKVREMLEKRLE